MAAAGFAACMGGKYQVHLEFWDVAEIVILASPETVLQVRNKFTVK